MSAATAGATAAMTACLAAIVLDDERRRRAEGYDDLIDYDGPISAPWRMIDFVLAAFFIGGPMVCILAIAWLSK
ncbi:hypothetical protein Cp1R7AA1_005 [Mesorhizobium phage Cp1R7A-A1]|nr:hypothetical protein Cp1R7AA1_005 [Mesorhizobium phage Cp1R7A-A1]